MKISKLFHWLYAILLLMPFMFFIPSVLYYAFNDNSTMQTVEVPVIKIIPVDFNQQIRNGDFEEDSDWIVYPTNVGSLTIADNKATISVVEDYGNSWDYGLLQNRHTFVQDHKYYVSCEIESADITSFRIEPAGTNSINVGTGVTNAILDIENVLNNNFLIFPLNNYSTTGNSYSVSNVQCFDLTQMFGAGNEPTIAEFKLMFPLNYYPYTESQPMQVTYDTGETEQLISNTDIINYAWESIWELPLFNWCKVSFVTIPFSYITSLFGIAASSSLNYVFTYFISISICWLVFDVLMYVPMLVHRWIDKARLE